MTGRDGLLAAAWRSALALAMIFGLSVVPATARRGQTDSQANDVALDFARAYVDQDLYLPAIRNGLESQVDACVAAQKMSSEQATIQRASINRYVSVWRLEFPTIQEKIAASVRSGFDLVELTELDTFFRSDVGRKMLSLAVSQIVQGLSGSQALCGTGPPPAPDRHVVAASVVAKLSPLETSDLAAFGSSATGRKFQGFVPTLLPVLRDAIVQAKTEAVRRSGFTSLP